jgi:hypothetical protein
VKKLILPLVGDVSLRGILVSFRGLSLIMLKKGVN